MRDWPFAKRTRHIYLKQDTLTSCCACGCPLIIVPLSSNLLWVIHWTLCGGKDRNTCFVDEMCHLCHFTLFHPWPSTKSLHHLSLRDWVCLIFLQYSQTDCSWEEGIITSTRQTCSLARTVHSSYTLHGMAGAPQWVQMCVFVDATFPPFVDTGKGLWQMSAVRLSKCCQARTIAKQLWPQEGRV